MKHGRMSPSTYSLFNFAKGQCLHIPDDFSAIKGWFVRKHSIVKVNMFNSTVNYIHTYF